MSGRAPVEALVQVGDVETRYVCAGQGPPVLLLTDEDPAAAVETPLFRALAESCRVVSAAPSPDLDTGPWLRALIEGLGLERPDLLVASRRSDTWAEAVLAEVGAGCAEHLGASARADLGAPMRCPAGDARVAAASPKILSAVED